jgi:cell division protein FtsQ
MTADSDRLRYIGFLTTLIMCAVLLSARMVYVFLADPERFPINTVKIAASYQHITRKQLEGILSKYLSDSFVFLPVSQLQEDLMLLDWSGRVKIVRIWPDTLKITVVEKAPVALWNESLMTADGQLFQRGNEPVDNALPRLSGPKQQQRDILQSYQKLSKLLSTYGLMAEALQLRDNQAWELTLTNGVQLHLGKRDLETRLMRFVKAYPVVFADKVDQLSGVDLRYARGMAVQWKQQTGR